MIGKSFLLVQFDDGRCELVGVTLGSARLYVIDESDEVLGLHVPGRDRIENKHAVHLPPCVLILRKNGEWKPSDGAAHIRDIRVTVVLQINMNHGFARRWVMPPGHLIPEPKRKPTKPIVKQEPSLEERPPVPGARVVRLLDRDPKKIIAGAEA